MYYDMSSLSKSDSHSHLKKSSVNYKNYMNRKITLNKMLGGIPKAGRFNTTYNNKKSFELPGNAINLPL